jgi:hypothetical protein
VPTSFLENIPSLIDEDLFRHGNGHVDRVTSPDQYGEPDTEDRCEHEEEWHQIAAHPTEEQAGIRLILSAKPANEAPRLQALKCSRTFNGRSLQLVPLGATAASRHLSLALVPFVAFGLTWALVDSVNSFRTGEARAEARETIEYECRGSSTHSLA